MKKIETVSLIGLGAMGAFLAPKLYERLGQNFHVVAGGERKLRLQEKGVSINQKVYRFPVTDPAEAAAPVDLILIAVKGYALEQAIQDIRGLVGPETLIMAVLNGVDSERKIAAAFGEEHLLYSYMRVSIVMRDGCTAYDPALGNIHFGEKTNESYSERVQAVKELFDACRIAYEIDPDMLHGIWFKFMCNVGENLTCAMLGIPFGGFVSSEDASYIRIAAMKEVAAVAKAEAGVILTEEEMMKQDETIRGLPERNKPSTLQDLEAGKHTEVDMFAGEVIRLGHKHGIPTPVCEVLYHAVRVLEQKNDGKILGLS